MSITSGIITPPADTSPKSANPIYVYGEALVSKGLFTRSAVNGIGLVTNGLCWQYRDIWLDVDYYSNLSTVWTSPTGVMWGNSGGPLTTTWTSPTLGMWGDVLPT